MVKAVPREAVGANGASSRGVFKPPAGPWRKAVIAGQTQFEAEFRIAKVEEALLDRIRGSVGLRSQNDPFDVAIVQKLLAIAGLRLGVLQIIPKKSDGRIDAETIAAISAFEIDVMKKKKSDSKITLGERTWARLVKEAGRPDLAPDGYPQRPAGVTGLGNGGRDTLFTTFIITDPEAEGYPGYEDDPSPGAGADDIKILPAWKKRNIGDVDIPQLKTLGLHFSKQFHKKAIPQLLGLWQAWEDAGLLGQVMTFDGAFVPRYKRKLAHTQSNISNHAWGTAFDINTAFNRLGSTPAIMWETGCVFDLVPLAIQWGFYWGGWFGGNRVDGMHFEVRRLTDHQLPP